MVLDSGCGLSRVKVAAGGLEEFQHRLLFELRRVGEVDHHLRAGHGLCEARAGDGVDAGIGRGSDDLVATLSQNGDGLRANQAGAADNDDLHCEPPWILNLLDRDSRYGPCSFPLCCWPYHVTPREPDLAIPAR